MPSTAASLDRPTALFLGVDAGASHCTALIGSDARTVLGRAVGPAAAMRPGAAAAVAAVIADTARRAAAQAGVPLPVARAVVGAAGAGRPREQNELAKAVAGAGVADQVRVVPDGAVALTTAFATGPGIVINAGTGSVAFARDAAGAVHRAGGHGWQLGDEGGGYWLGRRALDAAARAHDGRGEGSTLLARLLGALGLQSFDDLVRWTSTATPAQVAALAPQLLNAAREGEAVAQRVVAEAGRELVGLMRALERHFPGAAPIPVASVGGLLTPGSPLATAFAETLAAQFPRAHLAASSVEPALGALKLAATEGGA